ncbi:MAG: hypothetical protein KF722_04625 [Nitrospira sp.]|nr:hypothetical protein [Nitrospira sp.]
MRLQLTPLRVNLVLHSPSLEGIVLISAMTPADWPANTILTSTTNDGRVALFTPGGLPIMLRAT